GEGSLRKRGARGAGTLLDQVGKHLAGDGGDRREWARAREVDAGHEGRRADAHSHGARQRGAHVAGGGRDRTSSGGSEENVRQARGQDSREVGFVGEEPTLSIKG